MIERLNKLRKVILAGLFAMVILPSFAVLAVANQKRIILIGADLVEIADAFGESASKQIVAVDSIAKKADIDWVSDLPNVGYKMSLNLEGIISLKADYLIASDQKGHATGPAKVLNKLKSQGVTLEIIEDDFTVSSIEKKIDVLAEVLSMKKKAVAMKTEVRAKFRNLERLVKQEKTPPKVAFLLYYGGQQPLVAGTSTAGDAVIRLAGGVNIIKDQESFMPVSAESFIKMKPDFIIISQESLTKIGGMGKLQAMNYVRNTPAGSNNNIIVIDDNMIFFSLDTADHLLEIYSKLYYKD